MIPQHQDAVAARDLPSKTWLLDHTNRRIVRIIDGAAAVLQAAFCAIQTPRGAHVIYSGQYGSDLYSLVGRDREYALSEGRRMIQDALGGDPRIVSVSNFRTDGDAAVFDLQTIFARSEVRIEKGLLL